MPDAGKAQSYVLDSVKANGATHYVASTTSVQERYAILDKFAKKLPDSQATTLRQLASSLAAYAKNDDEKARIIFAWLAYHVAYDFKSLKSKSPSNCQPTHVLQTRMTICQGYADLFTALATRMNLPAQTIIGYGKGSLLRNEDLAKDTNHAWNCYLSDNTWHLLDATWAAGSLISNVFVREYDPFWFDTPPGSFIVSHLPEAKDSLKQFLPSLVPEKTFFMWPNVDKEFFKVGISGSSIANSFAGYKSHDVALPKIFGPSWGVQIKKVPQFGKLQAKSPVKFVFTAPENIEMSIKNGEAIIAFEKKAGLLYKEIIPNKNDLIILISKKSVPNRGYHFLHYTTVQLPVQPTKTSKLALDSVRYLRQ